MAKKLSPEEAYKIRLQEVLDKGYKDVEFCLRQKQPYSAVHVGARLDGTSASGVGFSKVSWPDECKPSDGYYIAAIRAMRCMMRGEDVPVVILSPGSNVEERLSKKTEKTK